MSTFLSETTRFGSLPLRRGGLGWGFLALALFTNVVTADAPTVKQFVQMKWPGAGSLAPDGSFYYIHNPDGLNQLYCRPAGTQEAVKLTDFPDGMSGYNLSQDGRWIIVTAGVGGNEQTGLYLIDAKTRRLRALYVHPDVVYGASVWRRDSQALAFRANDKSSSDFYIYIYDLATNSTKCVHSEKGDWAPVDFSSDGRRLMIVKSNSATYSQLFEINLADGKAREITPAGEQWSFEAIGYTADDKEFYVISDYKGDMAAFFTINLASGQLTKLFPQFNTFEADNGVFNPERTLLAICFNEDGYRSMHLYAMPEKKKLPTPDLPKGLVGNIEFCGDQMLFAQDNANSPGVIYQWTIGKTDEKPKALTKPDTQGIDVNAFSLPELVRYKTFDDLAIPAFVYFPPGYKKGDKIPFVIEYHGGPEGQTRPTFNRIYQYLLSQGFGIMAPNVRGSSGYGRRYLEMDNYKKRMDSVRDGIAAAKWLVAEGLSTPSQIAAYGGSYGGFMVMACITEAPEAYGAACNVVGIGNFETFLERTKDYRRKLREVEYGPLTDRAFLKSVSPIYKVDRIRVPLLIAHGDNDPRVPVYEARQLYDKLQSLGKPVEILTFPDEGHGFRKENNRITFAERLTAFLSQHLKPR
jgi:dipeptidyl aminopeptidase/acylaminoacyl peptidase